MPNGTVSLSWADGDYEFNLAKLGIVLELEEKCDSGVAEIFNRLKFSRWHFNDVREVLRLGLIGGGLPPQKALLLVKRYVDERPWIESVQPALTVLMAAMVGVPGDEVGKKPEAERKGEQPPEPSQPSAPMAGSSVPPSTASAQL